MTAQDTGLAPLPVEQWSEKARALLPQYLRRPQLYLSGTPDDLPMPQALGLLAHHVDLGAAWMAFMGVLADERSTLEPVHRELAILRVAWRSASAYEWTQHIRIGAQAGLTTEKLYAIPDGPAATVWTPLERSIMKASDEVVDLQGIRPSTWAALAQELNGSQILELCFVIGGYLCFAAVTNSTQLKPDPPTEHIDAPPLNAREG
jgi:4-carboxymuconolactone decarboxylase